MYVAIRDTKHVNLFHTAKLFGEKISGMQDFFASNVKTLRERAGLKGADMFDKVGVKRTTWSNYENRTSKPAYDDLRTIANYFGVSLTDLVERPIGDVQPSAPAGESGIQRRSTGNRTGNRTGKGGFLADSGVPYHLGAPRVITVDKRGNENISHVPVKSQMGYLNGYGDPAFIESLETYQIPFLKHGTFRSFETEGPSMAPTLRGGDIVFCRWVESLADVKDGRVHTIVSKSEGIVTKRVLNRLERDGKLYLKSDTLTKRAEYPTRPIEPEDILEVWAGVFYLSPDFSEPSDIFTRLADLEISMSKVNFLLDLQPDGSRPEAGKGRRLTNRK